MTADLVKRLRIKGPQGDEKSNHLFRRLHIERVEAAARIEALEAELAAERTRAGKLVEAGNELAGLRSVWTDPHNDEIRKAWTAALAAYEATP